MRNKLEIIFGKAIAITGIVLVFAFLAWFFTLTI